MRNLAIKPTQLDTDVAWVCVGTVRGYTGRCCVGVRRFGKKGNKIVWFGPEYLCKKKQKINKLWRRQKQNKKESTHWTMFHSDTHRVVESSSSSISAIWILCSPLASFDMFRVAFAICAEPEHTGTTPSSGAGHMAAFKSRSFDCPDASSDIFLSLSFTICLCQYHSLSLSTHNHSDTGLRMGRWVFFFFLVASPFQSGHRRGLVT